MATLRALFGIDLPIIQAPMGGAQGSALAAAVSNAGGLGSVPCAMLGPDGIRDELVAMRKQASGPFNVNFFCNGPPNSNEGRDAAWRAALAPYYREYEVEPGEPPPGAGPGVLDADAVDVLEEFRPAVVSFHFGLPSDDLLARLKGLGAKVISSATTVDEAMWLEARGVDAIIAQGLEAGGHRGMFLTDDVTTQIGTLALVRQVVSAVSVPVIAAGGIADARSVAAAMTLGAAGVQVGTALLLCPEALTSPLHRAALTSPAARHTAITNVFTGRPARAIVNRIVRELGPLSDLAPDFPSAASGVVPLRMEAERRGITDFSSFWCGQNATGCREAPAADLIRELAAELSS